MKVQNHTTAIEKALHLDEGSVKHEGNFLFSGKLNGCKVMICTEPVNEMQNEISIYSMEIGEPELNLQELKEKIEELAAQDECVAVVEKNGQHRHGIIAICTDGRVKVYFNEGAGDGSDDVIMSFEEFVAQYELAERR